GEGKNRAIESVRSDKLRAARAGHDGTWVAHPGLVAVAREVFDAHMNTPNQIETSRDPVTVGARDLLAVPEGEITQSGLELNVDVGIQYLEAWLGGKGGGPIFKPMGDAATGENARPQGGQSGGHGGPLRGGGGAW